MTKGNNAPRKAKFLRILVVEDRESRVKTLEAWCPGDVRFTWAKSAGQALGVLERDRGRVYDGIMLDFDLYERDVTSSDRHFNGKHVVAKIIAHVENDVPVFVHSANVSGGPEMAKLLEGAGFDVTRTPWSQVTKAKYLTWIEEVRQAHAEAHD